MRVLSGKTGTTGGGEPPAEQKQGGNMSYTVKYYDNGIKTKTFSDSHQGYLFAKSKKCLQITKIEHVIISNELQVFLFNEWTFNPDGYVWIEWEKIINTKHIMTTCKTTHICKY